MNLYKSAASALDHLDAHQGSVKGSLAAAGVKASGGEARRILALLIETLKYRDVLKQLLETVPIQKLEKEAFPRKGRPTSANLLLVLCHDLLFSPKGKIECSDKVDAKTAIMKHQTRLKAELVRLQIKAGKSSIRELGKEGLSSSVRYIRFNPRRIEGEKWTLDELHNHLQGEVGLNLLPEAKYPVPKNSYFMDPHMPDYLMVFESGANWWLNSEWYERGSVILQDKASCMPAAVIMAVSPSGSWEKHPDCIDGTSAPGNKTSLMSALTGANIFAFEKSPQRFRTLEKMLAKAHCANVEAQNEDFTAVNPTDYPSVGRILLDPSCSGSGIVNRLDYLVDAEQEDDGADTDRLEKLAAFQFQMIQHALKFPNVTRIVYSTCSIHAIEDENVIARVLAYSRSHPTRVNGESYVWTLEPRSNVLPTWHRRGQAGELSKADAEKVIRCAPEDHTNGFFVACLRRATVAEAEAEARVEAEAEAAAAAEADVEMEEQPEAVPEVKEVEPVAQKGKKGAKKGKKEPKAQPKVDEGMKEAESKGKKAAPAKAKEEAKGGDKKQAPKKAAKGGKPEAESKPKAEPAPVAKKAEEKSKKRPAEAEAETSEPKKAKTAAQLERARRKKKAQKAKTGN